MVNQEEDTEKESGTLGMIETLDVRRLTDRHEEKSTNLSISHQPMCTVREGEVRWGKRTVRGRILVTAAS